MDALWLYEQYEEEFWDKFGELQDPRSEDKIWYPLEEILLVSLATVISGGESWDDMVLFGNTKLKFLKQYLPFAHGIPTSITYERVFSLLDPEHFGECLSDWMSSFSEEHTKASPKLLIIDGKVLRGSHDHKHGKSAIHLVSVWCHKTGIMLGHQKVSDKSNEITAIPRLLDIVDIKGSVVSIDAMGCQKSIAAQIVESGGDYILALKGNHVNTYKEVQRFFNRHEKLGFKGGGYEFLGYACVDKGHGRIEERKITVLHKVGWLEDEAQWTGLASVMMVDSSRTIKGKTTTEKRYFISSFCMDAQTMLGFIRDHWGIENSMHWVLDVSFNEDKSRIRKRNADHNMATIRRLSLNLIKLKKQPKHSIKGTRKLAGWDDSVLKNILMF